MCLTAKNFGLQEENINISNPHGMGTTERDTDGQKDTVLYEKGG